MPFPASQELLANALTEAQRVAASVDREAADATALMQAGPVSANLILQVSANLGSAIAIWTRVRNTPGINDFAKEQYNDAGFDLLAALDALIADATTARDTAMSIVPKDANGWLLIQQFNPVTGKTTMRQAPSALTAPLVIALQSVTDEIS